MKKTQPTKIRAVIDALQKSQYHMPPLPQPGRIPDELANTQAIAKGRTSMRNTKKIRKGQC